MTADDWTFDDWTFEVIELTLRGFAAVEAVWRVSVVIGLAGLLLVAVGGIAIVRARRDTAPVEPPPPSDGDVQPVSAVERGAK